LGDQMTDGIKGPFLREGRKQGKMRTHFKLLQAAGMLAIGIISAGSASAALLPSGLLIDNIVNTSNGGNFVNPGFETSPDLTRWTTLGNTAAEAGDYKSNPEGALQAALSSSNSPAAVLGSTGVASTNIAGGNTFFGFAPGTLEAKNAQTISGIKQALTTTAANQVFTFAYDFLTNESAAGFPDFAFYSLQGPTGNASLNILGTPSTPGLVATSLLDGVHGDFTRESGYKLTGTFTTGAAGTYTLGFGVSDAVPVPLPSVALGGMALCGSLGLMQVARRRKQLAV
jgi:hypothetical protein